MNFDAPQIDNLFLIANLSFQGAFISFYSCVFRFNVHLYIAVTLLFFKFVEMCVCDIYSHNKIEFDGHLTNMCDFLSTLIEILVETTEELEKIERIV